MFLVYSCKEHCVLVLLILSVTTPFNCTPMMTLFLKIHQRQRSTRDSQTRVYWTMKWVLEFVVKECPVILILSLSLLPEKERKFPLSFISFSRPNVTKLIERETTKTCNTGRNQWCLLFRFQEKVEGRDDEGMRDVCNSTQNYT